MYFKSITLTILCLWYAPMSYAQSSKWISSYLLLTEKDTLKGSIEYVWRETPLSINFRSQDGSTKIYTAKEVLEFGFLDGTETFKSATFEIEKRTEKDFQKAEKGKISLQTITAFAQAVSLGEISLYKYVDKYRTYFLVHKRKQALVLLKHYTYYNQNITTQQLSLVADYQYRTQLNDMLSAAPKTALKTKNVSYRQGNLLYLLKAYHEEVNSNYTLKKTPNPAHIGVLGGLTSHKIKFLGPSTNEIYLIDFKPILSPTLGIAREKYFNPRRKNFSLLNELAWTGFKTKETLLSPSDIKGGAAPNLVREWQANFNIQHLKLTTLLRYKFNVVENKLQPFINIGFGYGISLRPYQEAPSRMGNTIISNTFEIGRKFSLIAGLGGRYKTFGADLRYEYSNLGTTNLPLLNQGSSLTAQFTYWFK